MSYFRPDLHRYFANQFVDGILHKKTTLYYFLGRTYPWSGTTGTKEWNPETSSYETKTVSDINPPALPDDAYQNDVEIRDNIVYVKRLESNNVTLSIRRINWTRGTTYYQWDSTKDMNQLNPNKSLKTPYYVINSDYSVFKCVFNNHGAPSTVEPKEKTYGILQTGDGYLWKYMYSIPKIQLTRFLSKDYIPCQKAITQSFYNLGAVESVVVRDGGMNYQTGSVVRAVVGMPNLIESYINPNGTEYTSNWLLDEDNNLINPETNKIYIVKTQGTFYNKKYKWDATTSTYSDTLDTGVRAELSLDIDDNGSIVNVAIIKKGRGYDADNPPLIAIEDDLHTGHGKYGTNPTAIIQANISGGQLDTVTILDPGIGYSSERLTKLVVMGDGSGCIVKPTIVDGKIASVEVVNGGTGYTHARISVVTERQEGVEYGNADLIAVLGGDSILTDQGVVEQTAIPGQIFSIEVTNGGNGYNDKCTVKIDGDGEGCAGKPIIVDGAIQSVTILANGQGYTSSDSIIVRDPNGSGEGAILKPVVSTDGDIVDIEVIDAGKNYSDETTLEVSSDKGEGCILSPNIENGVIRYIELTSYGKNYTRATISITSPTQRISTETTRYIDAEAYASIAPIGGHGSDAISELNASTATLYLALRYADTFGTLNQEFRQFGVLSNLTSYKNLISNVYGLPVRLNDTNWLFNSKDGLLSKKLINPIVTIYDPSNTVDDGYEYRISKSTTYNAQKVLNHIDYINVKKEGNGYRSNPRTTATAVDQSGSGAELMPYIKGSIKEVSVKKSGHGFELTTVRVKHNGVVDNNTIIKLSIASESGKITGARVIKNSQIVYEEGSAVLEIVSSRGSGAILKPLIDEDGKIYQVNVTNGGSGYTFTDLVVTDRSYKGSGAELMPNLTNGVISSIKVDFFGVNYSDDTTLVVIDGVEETETLEFPTKSAFPEVGEQGKTYYALDTPNKRYRWANSMYCEDARVTPIINGGKIEGVIISDGGFGYSNLVTIEARDPEETGSGASFTPILHNGLITSVDVITSGSNYIERSTSVSVNTNIYYYSTTYEDAEVEASFVGSIESIQVVKSGKNYSSGTTIDIQSLGILPQDTAEAVPVISSNENAEICLEPLSTKAENFTINAGYEVKYAEKDKVQIYRITSTTGQYIPIKNKEATNVITSEENLCMIIAMNNYNVETGEYPGLRHKDPQTQEYVNDDIVLTITQQGSNNDNKTETYVKYRVINVNKKEIMVQPLTSIQRTLNGTTSEEEGDIINYTYKERDPSTGALTGAEKSVRTNLAAVIDECTIDKYSGNLLYVANMTPLEFFEGKVAAVRTNIYF